MRTIHRPIPTIECDSCKNSIEEAYFFDFDEYKLCPACCRNIVATVVSTKEKKWYYDVRVMAFDALEDTEIFVDTDSAIADLMRSEESEAYDNDCFIEWVE